MSLRRAGPPARPSVRPPARPPAGPMQGAGPGQSQRVVDCGGRAPRVWGLSIFGHEQFQLSDSARAGSDGPHRAEVRHRPGQRPLHRRALRVPRVHQYTNKSQ